MFYSARQTVVLLVTSAERVFNWFISVIFSLRFASFFKFSRFTFRAIVVVIRRMSEEGYLKRESGFCTKACHAGQESEKWAHWEVVPPISTSTTYKQSEPGKPGKFEYSRSGNPSRCVLESCLAALEGSEHGLCFSSGLGVTTTLLFLLNSGDNIVCCDDVYGGTNRIFSKCASNMNITTTFVDPNDIEKLEQAMQPTTKMIWIESPTNPLLKVIDIKKVVATARKYKDVIVAVDNTFLTPYFQKPLNFGADISVYSLTKYMNGHSDVVMGAICTNNETLYKRILFLQNALGVVPSPFDCFQVNRSLKTLAFRMEQHMKNGLIVGKYLESHPQVERVLHPGLPSHPQHALLKKQCYGYSGILSFYLKGGLQHSKKFLSSLRIFTLAESLGGYESLAELPSVMTHASVPPEQREKLGITDSLIRLSVGLEDPEDLISDLAEAFKLSAKV